MNRREFLKLIPAVIGGLFIPQQSKFPHNDNAFYDRVNNTVWIKFPAKVSKVLNSGKPILVTPPMIKDGEDYICPLGYRGAFLSTSIGVWYTMRDNRYYQSIDDGKTWHFEKPETAQYFLSEKERKLLLEINDSQNL
jgi:hypothetical protein